MRRFAADHDCSGRIPGHTSRAPPVGFELETNGFQFYGIANLDKTCISYLALEPRGTDFHGNASSPGTQSAADSQHSLVAASTAATFLLAMPACNMGLQCRRYGADWLHSSRALCAGHKLLSRLPPPRWIAACGPSPSRFVQLPQQPLGSASTAKAVPRARSSRAHTSHPPRRRANFQEKLFASQPHWL